MQNASVAMHDQLKQQEILGKYKKYRNILKT